MENSPSLFIQAFLTYLSCVPSCVSQSSSEEAAAEEAAEKLLRDTFESEKFVPDIIPEPPLEQLQVIYNGSKVPLGGLIPFDQAANRPILKWDERDAFYTIIMTDPDSPSRSDPRLSELQHWIIGNVYRRNISSGETFAEYTGPRDAREFVVEEGIHRYIISVFEQIGKQVFTERRIPRENMLFRGLFNTSKFVKEYRLRGPVAASYFTVDHEATKLIPESNATASQNARIRKILSDKNI
nr:PREDICTED: protein D3-like isoform X2 [Bemisia tabaci]